MSGDTTKKSRGGRPVTGSPRFIGGRWGARVPTPDGQRTPVYFDGVGEHEIERAKSLAKRAAELARGYVAPTKGARELLLDWSDRWVVERELRKLSSAPEDRRTLKNHILPVLGGLAVADVTADDLRGFVAKLDGRVRAGGFAAKTAANIWGIVRAMFRDASRSKQADLRVREDNPAVNVQGPDAGERVELQFLYPSEFLALVLCEKVPLRWRRLYAVATYLGVRAGELAGLQWDAVDLEHATAHVHAAIDRVRAPKRTKGTKTKRARRIGLEANLVPLLCAMHAEAAGKGPVLALPSAGEMSRKLRVHLKRAGVTRADLFAREATRRPIRFHDTRSSCLTWMAVRGDNPIAIRERAGHGGLAMTEKYIRTAQALAPGFGVPFPELPAGLLNGAPGSTAPGGGERGFGPGSGFGSKRPKKHREFRWAQQDLNL